VHKISNASYKKVLYCISYWSAYAVINYTSLYCTALYYTLLLNVIVIFKIVTTICSQFFLNGFMHIVVLIMSYVNMFCIYFLRVFFLLLENRILMCGNYSCRWANMLYAPHQC